MTQEKTLTVLENCVVSYAKAGKITKTGNSMLSGIIQQRTPAGYFQASANFACFDSAVQSQILNVAARIADAEESVEKVGSASLTVEAEPRQKASVTVTLEGYHQTRAPKEGGSNWYSSFIITKVTLVDNSAIANQA